MSRPNSTPIAVSHLALLCCALAATCAHAQALYDDKVRVAADTQLDWAYPLVGTSPAEAPTKLLNGYVAKAQTYEFFGPPDAPAGAPLPLVIFVSPQDRPVGWMFWEPTCREHGVLFAGLRDMGNGKPAAHRVRAVLDVLDDLRERYPIDADRTYLAGFSGGAGVTRIVATALPEYFGGMICVGDAPEPPSDRWIMARVKQRLSVAIIDGDKDPSFPLVDDFFDPWWKAAGVRVETVALKNHSHTMPNPDVFADAFEWLEAGVSERRAAAKKLPALRIADAPSREEWADRVLTDAKTQLAVPDPESLDAGLQQLVGITNRWSDVPAAEAAKKLLNEYAARKDRPWEAVRKKAQQDYLHWQAEGFDALAQDGRASVRNERSKYAQNSITLWQKLREAGGDGDLLNYADERIAALNKLAKELPTAPAAVPLNRFRFDMQGDVTLAQAIEYTRTAVAQVGYTLEVDNDQLQAAGIDLDKEYKPRLKAVTLDDLNAKFFRRAGLVLQHKGDETTIRLIPTTTK